MSRLEIWLFGSYREPCITRLDRRIAGLDVAYSLTLSAAFEMVEIRKATVDDVPAVARVHVRADWETYAPLFGSQAYRLEVGESEQRWQRALAGGGLLLVATDKGAIVGLAHASRIASTPSIYCPPIIG